MLSLWGNWVGTLAGGLGITMEITALGLVLGVLLGALVAAGRLSRWRVLRLVSTAYVDVLRGLPVLVLLFLAYYGLGQVGIRLPGTWAAVLTLGVFYASLFAEIFRGAIQALEHGQWEAADALGMTPGLRLRKVILPQAFLAILLPSTNTISEMLKDSSLVLTIGVADLMARATQAASTTAQPMAMFILAGLFYFALYLLISRALARWELRVQRRYL